MPKGYSLSAAKSCSICDLDHRLFGCCFSVVYVNHNCWILSTQPPPSLLYLFNEESSFLSFLSLPMNSYAAAPAIWAVQVDRTGRRGKEDEALSCWNADLGKKAEGKPPLILQYSSVVTCKVHLSFQAGRQVCHCSFRGRHKRKPGGLSGGERRRSRKDSRKAKRIQLWMGMRWAWWTQYRELREGLGYSTRGNSCCSHLPDNLRLHDQ